MVNQSSSGMKANEHRASEVQAKRERHFAEETLLGPRVTVGTRIAQLARRLRSLVGRASGRRG
jgi:hypothetical protein